MTTKTRHSIMPAAASFTHFSALPAELRLLIWEEALRAPTAVIYGYTEHRNARNLSLRTIGNNAELIGRSCKEANRQMREICRKFKLDTTLVLRSNFH